MFFFFFQKNLINCYTLVLLTMKHSFKSNAILLPSFYLSKLIFYLLLSLKGDMVFKITNESNFNSDLFQI
jgi:hypothetical protein